MAILERLKKLILLSVEVNCIWPWRSVSLGRGFLVYESVLSFGFVTVECASCVTVLTGAENVCLSVSEIFCSVHCEYFPPDQRRTETFGTTFYCTGNALTRLYLIRGCKITVSPYFLFRIRSQRPKTSQKNISCSLFVFRLPRRSVSWLKIQIDFLTTQSRSKYRLSVPGNLFRMCACII